MRIILLSAFMLSCTLAFTQNSCEEPLSVEAGQHTVELIDGAIPTLVCSSGGYDGMDFGEWYTYTAPMDHTITITSDLEINSGGDTRFQVYMGECDDLTCYAGNDDGGDIGNGYLSIDQFVLLEGESVTIVWDDRWSAAGFVFDIIESEYVEPPLEMFFDVEATPGYGTSRAIVDMNGDFLDDIVRVSDNAGIFLGLQTEDGELEETAIFNEPATFFPSWSLNAGDIDGNGYNDLVYGAGSGVSIMYANGDGTDYIEVSGSEYVFSQRGNCADINNDGHLDVFMCHDVDQNVYYINDGDGNLTYNQGGLGEVPGGNYGSIWVDYDNDGDSDLFIAKCSGGSTPYKENEMYRNNGDGTYTDVSLELNLFDPIQTWSSAWGDFDNDGDMDMFIGASSFSDGGHKLMRNDGDGVFVDVTEGSGLDTQTGTSIENTTHDFDNDGYLDLLGLGNTLMKNNGDMTFTFVESNINNGPVGDINNDGFLDVMNGDNLKYNIPNDNNFMVLNLTGTNSNINGIGSMIHIYYNDGQLQTREIRSGDGFRYMSSLNAHFGLGEVTEVDSVVVTWPSGIVDVILDPVVNGTDMIVEGTGSVTATDDNELVDFTIYPNPTTDKIYFKTSLNYNEMSYSVFDINGKLVDRGNVPTNELDVSQLPSGSYVLSIEIDGQSTERTIIKK